MTSNHENRVLLVQDDPKQTEHWSELIRGVADCQIDVVGRAEASIEWLARFNYHLVVVDLPGGAARGQESIQLLESVMRVSPATSVLVVAEDATLEEAVAVIRMGAEDYLRKPFDLEAFRLAVKRGLDRKIVFGDDSGASHYLNLVNSCHMISASLDQARILGIVQSHVMRELKSEHAAVYHLLDGNFSRIESPVQDPVHRESALEEVLDIAIQASGALRSLAASQDVYRFVERSALTPGLFVFRFRCVGSEDHYCVCLSPRRPPDLEDFESRLRLLRAQIEVTGRNIEQYQGVQQLAYLDDATGLYNTRYLYSILEREIAQASANRRSFAILFIDADRFKSVNDAHGHQAGTQLLNEVGSQLKGFVRGNDTVFRYGGDEFVAVLTSCDLPTARRVAERIRSSIEQHVFLAAQGKNIRLTVSIGVALFPEHADSVKAVIDAADHAMYAAKRATRNSVFIAPMPPGQTPPSEGQTNPPGGEEGG